MTRNALGFELPSEWKQVRGVLFARKVAILAACLGVGAFLTTRDSIALAALGTLVLGVMFAHAIELQHQCLHGTAVRSAEGNRFLGMLLGMPMFVPYTKYRRKHLQHHRTVGTAEDDGFFEYGDRLETMPAWRLVLRSLSLRRYRRVVQDMLYYLFGIGEDRDGLTPAAYRQTRQEYLAMALAVGAALALAPSLLLKLWLMPALLVAEAVHFWVELPEHFDCERVADSPWVHTRTVGGGRFAFWLTNGNNLHMEHHLFQSLPMEALPLVHRVIHSRLVHFDASYVAFARDRVLRRRSGGSGR